MQVVVGWSQRPDPVTWQGGRVSGIIAPDSQHIIRLVSDRAAAGLEPAQPPSLDDVPNNHFAYAIQWFLFARSEEHTSELQSLMSISYAVSCLKKKNHNNNMIPE